MARMRIFLVLALAVSCGGALAYAADDESEYESKACDEQAGAR